MKDSHTAMKVEFSVWNSNMCLKIKTDDYSQWFYQPIDESKPNHQEIIYFWILSKLKHAFYRMPVNKIMVDHSKEAVEYLGDHLKV